MSDTPTTDDNLPSSTRKTSNTWGKVLFVALVVAAIGGIWWFESGRLVHEAKTAVADQFRDPESAQFRRVRTVKNRTESKVCGEVNAKNGFGAYAGFVQFVYSPSWNSTVGHVLLLPKEGDVERELLKVIIEPCEPWPKD
ncbi:hypothetical protein [Malikia granosa]|uniref:Uncharacterized protein n=1 Tax=Malikia granosa TaxID=263067 RepID=A0A2S9K404_9BURK|nr:hypothetical protein [Malikia granosa]PRD65171.1 hypothetical protein C6P64_10985 [Malikia granosa]